MPPRHYLYVCESKIDSLYQQIGEKQRLALAAGSETPLEGSEGKLRVVLSYLDTPESLGTVEMPGPYFRGRLSMQWGIMGDTALFVGQSEERERHFVLLGGSARYTVEADYPGSGATGQPSSPFAGLLALFERADVGESVTDRPYSATNTLGARLLRRLPALVAQLQAVQTVEFVAETLAVETGADNRSGERDFLLIGSPLYVALAA